MLSYSQNLLKQLRHFDYSPTGHQKLFVNNSSCGQVRVSATICKRLTDPTFVFMRPMKYKKIDTHTHGTELQKWDDVDLELTLLSMGFVTKTREDTNNTMGMKTWSCSNQSNSCVRLNPHTTERGPPIPHTPGRHTSISGLKCRRVWHIWNCASWRRKHKIDACAAGTTTPTAFRWRLSDDLAHASPGPSRRYFAAIELLCCP